MTKRAADLPRRVAYQRAEQAMVAATQVVPRSLAQADEGLVLMLDIVGMGRINARHGFLIGDELLADIELMLRQQFGVDGCVARLPGDQFIIVLPHVTTRQPAILSARQAVGRVSLQESRWRKAVMDAHVGAAMWSDAASRRQVVRIASTTLKSEPVSDACVSMSAHRHRTFRHCPGPRLPDAELPAPRVPGTASIP